MSQPLTSFMDDFIGLAKVDLLTLTWHGDIIFTVPPSQRAYTPSIIPVLKNLFLCFVQNKRHMDYQTYIINIIYVDRIINSSMTFHLKLPHEVTWAMTLSVSNFRGLVIVDPMTFALARCPTFSSSPNLWSIQTKYRACTVKTVNFAFWPKIEGMEILACT